MTFDAQRLYDLLPAIHRIRDAGPGPGKPLHELLTVIGEQAGVLEENLEQLYDDLFIETCADWVTPYIGDLIGYRPLHAVTPKVASPRAEVANTIAYRRRKGTATILEQLARDVTGWHARVVEFFELLATTQFMNHLRPHNLSTPDLRRGDLLERLDTPFETISHNVDVRSITTGRGRFNIRNIGIFLWRLGACPLSDATANRVDAQRFRFDPLGTDMQLFTRPVAEDDITHLAEPLNVPTPISRRLLRDRFDDYYGEGKSILLKLPGDGGHTAIDASEISVCDLSDITDNEDQVIGWAHVPPPTVAIDPVLGRIAFPAPLEGNPLVRFHYGFSADMGGGEYERRASFDAALAIDPRETVPDPHNTIQAALDALIGDGVVEISNSHTYRETPSVSLKQTQHVELRAANDQRPVMELEAPWLISGADESELTLNGLVIVGGALQVPAESELKRLTLRHCTLVPGRGSTAPAQSDAASLIVNASGLIVEIDQCILGTLRVVRGAQVSISDSIVDATDAMRVAYAAPGAAEKPETPGGSLTLESSTVIGRVYASTMPQVSNSILFARPHKGDDLPSIRSELRQQGCVRFSYVPPDARVPRTFRCQPEQAVREALEAAKRTQSVLSAQAEAEIRQAIELKLEPNFTDTRYGQPGYAQLTTCCSRDIREGAEDEAEMGAFRALYQPQRETNLRVRLDEYLRFGLEAGISYAT